MAKSLKSLWLNNSTDELFESWKNFRNSLKSLTEEETIKNTNVYFASVPREDRTLDYYTPSSWPTPWEVLNDKTFCNNSVTLLVYYTLFLAPSIDNDKLDIYLLDDGQDEFIVVLYKNKYLLNYIEGKTLDISQHKGKFKFQKIKKEDIREIN